MRLGVAGALCLALPWPENPVLSAEKLPSHLAVGRLIGENGQIGTDPIYITGIDYNLNYLVTDGKTQTRLPITKVLIFEGYPWRNVGFYRNLGVRLDNLIPMETVKQAGAGRIRIRVNESSVGVADSEFENVLAAAEKAKVGTLLVIDTNHPWEGDNEARLVKMVQTIFALHPRAELEILNEIDDQNAVRWEGRNLATAAHFTKVVIETVNEMMWKKGHQTKLWLPALIDVANTPFFVQALKTELGSKLPLNRLWNVGQAMHFYPDLNTDPKLVGIANGVWYASDQFFKIAGRYPKIAVTEVGQRGNYLDRIAGINFVKNCFQQPGVGSVYFHELLNHSEGSPLDTDFGLIDANGQAWPAYYYLAALGRRMAGY